MSRRSFLSLWNNWATARKKGKCSSKNKVQLQVEGLEGRIVPSSNLVAAYNFDAGSGTVLTDLSGNGNNGTINNATWTTGKFGNALQFTGNTNSYVSVASSASLNLTKGMTLEAWIDPTSLNSPDHGWASVVSKEHLNSSNDVSYALYAAQGTGVGPGPQLLLHGNDQGPTGSSVVPLNQWTFLAATYDGSTIKMYVNGNLVASQSISGTITTTNDPLTIGGDWSGEMFTGKIDNIRIYNTALSQSAIKTDMNTPIGSTPSVTSVAPANSATNVAISTSITATFNEGLNASTVTTSTVQLTDPTGKVVPSTVSYNSTNNTVTLTPNSPLSNNLTYSFTIFGGVNGVKDANGNSMTSNFTSTFTTVAKTAVSVTDTGPTAVTAGATVTYTITVTNSGPATAQGVVLTDTLPTGATNATITAISGKDPDGLSFGAASGGVFTSNAGTMAVGNTDSFQVVVIAPSSLASGAAFNNNVSVTTTTTNSGSPTSASVNNTITTSAAVSVTASGPSAVTAGTTVTYTITVTNGGPSNALGVVLTDTIPTGGTNATITAVSGKSPDNLTFGALTGGAFTSNSGTVAAGNSDQFQVVVTAPSSLASGAAFNDSVSVTTTTTNTGSPTSASVNNTVVVVPASAALSVTETGPTAVTAGTTVTYTITVTNGGTFAAQGVVLTDALPTGGTNATITAVSGKNPDNLSFGAASGGLFTSNSGTVAAGNTDQFQVVVTAPSSLASGAAFNDSVSVTTTTTNTGSPTSASVNNTIVTSAGVSVADPGPLTVTAGTTVTYTITVTNAGPSNGLGVVLTDTIPTGATNASITAVTGGNPDGLTFGALSGGAFTSNPGTVALGNTDTFLVVVTAPSSLASGSAFNNTVSVTTTTSNTGAPTSVTDTGTIVTSGSSIAPNEPLLYQSNIQYVGAFRVPGVYDPLSGDNTYDYGGTALAFNPTNNSLFIVGMPYDQAISEISIPQSIVNSTNLNALATASVLQAPVQVLNKIPNQEGTHGGTLAIGGLMVVNGKLIGTEYDTYDASGTDTLSHFELSSLNLSTATVSGLYQVGAQGAGLVAGYMAPIPSEWQAALGDPYLTGQADISIISRTSSGPAAFGFNPGQLGSTPAPDTPYVNYPSTAPLGPYTGQADPLQNGNSHVNGVAFVPGTSSVLFFGSTGTNYSGYGLPSDYGDNNNTSKGPHSLNGQYALQVWAYNANDFVAAKQGTIQPDQVMPYDVWNMTLPIPASTQVGGVAFDPSTGRLYLSVMNSDTQAAYTSLPLIEVFQVTMGAPPPAPQVGTLAATTTQAAPSGSTSPYAPGPVPPGTPVLLTAGNVYAINSGASITQVAFYLVINGVNELLGYGTQSTIPNAQHNYTLTMSTTGLAAGTYTLLVQALDSGGLLSNMMSTQLTIQ
jgi:uncharacterized repeat protein (TIGR01451 family)